VQQHQCHRDRQQRQREEDQLIAELRVPARVADPVFKVLAALGGDRDRHDGDGRRGDHEPAERPPPGRAQRQRRHPEGGEWQHHDHEVHDERVNGQPIDGVEHGVGPPGVLWWLTSRSQVLLPEFSVPTCQDRAMDGDGMPSASRLDCRGYGRSMLHIVALVGIDGVGKTTQARLLTEWLAAQGIAALYIRNAGGRRWFNRLAARLGRRDADALLGRSGMLVVEAVLRWLSVARAVLRAGRFDGIAVMDRYIWCQSANVIANGGRGRGMVRLMFGVFPKPELTCHLAVPTAVAYARVEARGTDHEDLAHLAAKDAAYRSLAEAGDFVTIDATGSVEDVQRRLRCAVLALLARRTPGAATAP
jgi:thymidylate kinase